MNMNIETLHGKDTTVKRIMALAARFKNDIPAGVSLPAFFGRVRAIPYRRDISGIEVTARPALSLKHGPAVGIDCKKKCILMVAYAEKNHIPWRVITSSKRTDKRHHHVFPQFLIHGRWVNADATYPHYKFGEKKPVTSWKAYSA